MRKRTCLVPVDCGYFRTDRVAHGRFLLWRSAGAFIRGVSFGGLGKPRLEKSGGYRRFFGGTRPFFAAFFSSCDRGEMRFQRPRVLQTAENRRGWETFSSDQVPDDADGGRDSHGAGVGQGK